MIGGAGSNRIGTSTNSSKASDSLTGSPSLAGSAIRSGKDTAQSESINRHVDYYTVAPSVVHVIRVLHERMEPGRHFSDPISPIWM